MTFNKRMIKLTNYFLERFILEEENVFQEERPLWFGKWSISIGLSPHLNQWHQWDELSSLLHNMDVESFVHPYPRTLHFQVYTNDPSVLKQLFVMKSRFVFNFIKWIPTDCWELPKKVPERWETRDLWYGKYKYRIRFKRPHDRCLKQWDYERISSDWYINPTFPELMYLQNLHDVTCIKILAYDSIIEINERDSINALSKTRD